MKRKFQTDEEIKAKAIAEFTKMDLVAVRTVADLLSDDEILTVYVPELDSKIDYKKIKVGDFFEVLKEKDTNERTIKLLHKMLAGADETLTLEQVKSLPFDMYVAILNCILQQTPLMGVTPKK